MPPEFDALEKGVRVGGVWFDALRLEALLDHVSAAVADRRRLRIAFANAEFVIEAARNADLARYLERCHYTVADGASVVAASRLAGRALPERVTGTDFLPALMDRSSRDGLRVGFVGGAPGIADRAVQRFRDRFPGCIVGLALNGYDDIADTGHAIRRLNAASLDVLMVCLGNPRQERWIWENEAQLEAPVLFGNGGALDFWSGHRRRAPIAVQRLGLEWGFRMLQDPSWSRLRRQARLWRFGYVAFTQRSQRYRTRGE